MWKVFNINSGRVIKAGFQDEEAAKDWLELRRDLVAEEYSAEEMDADEEEDFLERLEEDGEDGVPITEIDDDDDDDDDDDEDDDDEFADDDTVGDVLDDDDEEEEEDDDDDKDH